MVRPATKQLGVLGILREVLAIPLRNAGLMASVVLLLLLPCNLLLTVPKLTRRLELNINLSPRANRLPDGESPAVAESGAPPSEVPRINQLHISVMPLNNVVADLSMLAMVYLSAVACKGKHSTLGALLSKVRRSWRKVAVTFLYVKLFYFTYFCLFLMLGALNTILKIHTLVLFLVLLALFSALCFAFLVFLYLDIACQLSLVISAVEEDKCGLAALAKAFSVTRGRRLQGLVLTALCFVLQRFTSAAYAKTGGGTQTEVASLVVVWRFARVLVGLSVSLFGWLLWTVYYHECKKSHGLMGEEERVGEGQSLMPMSCSVEGDPI